MANVGRRRKALQIEPGREPLREQPSRSPILNALRNQALRGLTGNPAAARAFLAAGHGLGNHTIQRLMQAMDSADIVQTDLHPLQQDGAPARTRAVQRKVQVRDGRRYDKVPQGTEAPRFKALAESPFLYLVKAQQDIDLMLQQQDAPVLAPRKHLIGEKHDDSRFTDAVRDWAWGAELLIEAYGSHARLSDRAQAEKRTNPTGSEDEMTMWRKAKALEDRGAKALTNLVQVRIFGNLVVKAADELSDPAKFQAQDKRQLKIHCSTFWQKCDLALTVVTELAGYLRASSEERGWGIFGSYFPEHERLQKTVTVKLIEEMGQGQDNVKDQIDHLDVFRLSSAKLRTLLRHVDAVIAVLQRLIVAHDPGVTLRGLQSATETAIAQGQIGSLSGLRERYMHQRIDSAGVPALVKIGAHHVANLKDNLPANTLAFASYDEFQKKNTAEQVDV